MCTGAEGPALSTWLAAGQAAATVYMAYDAAEQGKKRAQQELDRSNKVEAERKDAESKAVQQSYAQNAMARRAIRSNSLFTGGGQQTLGV